MPVPQPPRPHVVQPVHRGGVYFAEVPGIDGEKPYLVISNNGRNQHFNDFLVVRITTSTKREALTRVVLGPVDEPIVGTVLCDEVGTLYSEDLTRFFAYLPHATMMRVDDALRVVLAL